LIRSPAKIREAVSQIAGQIECPAALGDDRSIVNSITTVSKHHGDSFRRAEEELAVLPPHCVRAVERGAMTDRDQHVMQPVPFALVVVNVARRYDAKSYVGGDVNQGAGECPVSPNHVALQLDEELIGTEHRATPLGETACRGDPAALEGAGEETVSAAGENDQPIVVGFERCEIEPRVATVGLAEVRLCEEPAEVRIPTRRFGEQRHVRAVEQRHLGAGDRLDTELLRLLGERHRAIDAVVVGEGDARVPEIRGGERELLGQRGAVEKRECRMAVKLRVHRRSGGHLRLLSEPITRDKIFE